MTTPAQETTELFATLQPLALADYVTYIMSRTRADLQALMAPLAAGDPMPAPPLPANQVIVSSGDAIPVKDGSKTVNAPATVAGGVLTGAQLGSTTTMVANAAAVVVHNLADANQAGSPGTATVAAGVLSKVNLTV